MDPALGAVAAALRTRGEGDLAAEVERAALRLAAETDELRRTLFESLAVNHDINNALVGVYGNAQLLGMGPAAATPGVKERLEVILREAQRIKEATQRLSKLKHSMALPAGTLRPRSGSDT